MKWVVAALDCIRGVGVWIIVNWLAVLGALGVPASLVFYFIGRQSEMRNSRRIQTNFDELFKQHARQTAEQAESRIALEKLSGNPPGPERVKQIVAETVKASLPMSVFVLDSPILSHPHITGRAAFAFEVGDGSTWVSTSMNPTPRVLTAEDRNDLGDDLLWIEYSPAIDPRNFISPAHTETPEDDVLHSARTVPPTTGIPNPDEMPKKKD